MQEGDDLATLLGFQLKMWEMESDALARDALAEFEISPARAAALMLIRANRGCTQSALGEALNINRSSAMKLVNYLEERGFVRRDPGADLRANALHLTERGESALDRMVEALHAADRAMLSVLTAEEAETLVALIRRARTRAATRSAVRAS